MKVYELHKFIYERIYELPRFIEERVWITQIRLWIRFRPICSIYENTPRSCAYMRILTSQILRFWPVKAAIFDFSTLILVVSTTKITFLFYIFLPLLILIFSYYYTQIYKIVGHYATLCIFTTLTIKLLNSYLIII